jgi:hypothetical protein
MPAQATPSLKSPALADVNADLGERIVVDTARMPWEPSPSGTVWRKPLFRHGGQFRPVTSLVRYAPGGAFPEHTHPQGEEILVLDGVFSDEYGDYPAGTFPMHPTRAGIRRGPGPAVRCSCGFASTRERIGRGGSRTRLPRKAGDRGLWMG